MSYPEFSVAMSVYKNDSPIFFLRALESITQAQTVQPNEIVLVVDGPVGAELDDAISRAAQTTPALRVLRLEVNGGLGNALKVATEAARYELIARMDSDDVSSPTRFAQQLDAFEQDPTLDIVGGDITEFIDREDNIVGRRAVPVAHDDIAEYMKRRCPFNHVSVMYKKSAVLRAGGYLDLFWNEDYYLWIRMWEHGCRFANTGTSLVNVRTGADMYRRRGGKRYFKSELFLQKYMKKRAMIGAATYLSNCTKRFIVQILLPNRVRGWVFKKFARKKK